MKSEPQKPKQSRQVWIIEETKCLSTNELSVLMDIAKQIKSNGLGHQSLTLIRRWFMIELGLNTGLRVSEMASLEHQNLLIDQNRSSIVVVGKGNKKRSIWISSKFKKICLEYISIKKALGYKTTESSPLLCNLKGNPISKRSLQKDFKSIIAQAGLSPHYSIHCLRHTYATFLLKASNHNYRFVQNQLGHASIRTTQVYAGILETEGRRAIEKLYI